MEEHQLNILSAEDDLDDQFLLKKAINKADIGGRIDFVSDGKSLIERLTKQYEGHLPDILLIDLNLPIMDGLEVLKVLRECEGINELPVIILTTSNDQKDIDRCYGLGAKSFITKPDSFDELVEVTKSFYKFKK